MSTDFAEEMLALNRRELGSIDPPEGLVDGVLAAASLKTGARKRQIKYLAGVLRRHPDFEARLLELLEERRGSAARENKLFHQLELLRDQIISEALATKEAAEEEEERFNYPDSAPLIREAAARLPDLDTTAVARAAENFCYTRKKSAAREIFRLLKSAAETAEVKKKLNNRE